MTCPAGVVGYELLGLVDRKVRDAVDARVGHQLQRVWALEEEVHHVVRLVEQDRGLAPGALLAAPVRELVRDDRVDVGADLRVAQALDHVSGFVEDFLEVAGRHLLSPSRRVGRSYFLSAELAGFGLVIAGQQRVGPSAGVRQRIVFDDDGIGEHRLFFAVRLQPLVRL